METFLVAFRGAGVEYAGSGVAKKLERGTSLVLHVILSILLRAALRYSTECVDTKVVLAEQDTYDDGCTSVGAWRASSRVVWLPLVEAAQ